MAACLSVSAVNAFCSSMSSLGFALYRQVVREIPASLHALRLLSCPSVTRYWTASRFTSGVRTFFPANLSGRDSQYSFLQTSSSALCFLFRVRASLQHRLLPCLHILLSSYRMLHR